MAREKTRGVIGENSVSVVVEGPELEGAYRKVEKSLVMRGYW